MPIPTARTLAHHVLRKISDGGEHDVTDVYQRLTEMFNVTREEGAQRIPSGRETVLANRIRNANYSLRTQALATFPTPATIQITDKGRSVLETTADAVRYTTTGLKSGRNK